MQDFYPSHLRLMAKLRATESPFPETALVCGWNGTGNETVCLEFSDHSLLPECLAAAVSLGIFPGEAQPDFFGTLHLPLYDGPEHMSFSQRERLPYAVSETAGSAAWPPGTDGIRPERENRLASEEKTDTMPSEDQTSLW